MADCPLVLPSPIIAIRTVPAGRRLALLSARPRSEIRSRVEAMRQFATSPELTQASSPSHRAGTFRDGVPPTRMVAMSATRAPAHDFGSDLSANSEASFDPPEEVPRRRAGVPRCVRVSLIFIKATCAGSNPTCDALQSSVSRPEQPAERTACRNRFRFACARACFSREASTTTSNSSTLAAIRFCSARRKCNALTNDHPV